MTVRLLIYLTLATLAVAAMVYLFLTEQGDDED